MEVIFSLLGFDYSPVASQLHGSVESESEKSVLRQELVACTVGD